MRAVLALLLTLVATPAGAEEVAGRVDAVYVEASRGVFVAQGLRRAPHGPRWADVDIGGRKVLARVPDGMKVAPGDRIAVRVGEPKSSPLANVLPTTTVSRALTEANASVGRSR